MAPVLIYSSQAHFRKNCNGMKDKNKIFQLLCENFLYPTALTCQKNLLTTVRKCGKIMRYMICRGTSESSILIGYTCQRMG